MTYVLPPAVLAWLAVALSGRKNAAACLSLATRLGRCHAGSANLGRHFPLDRRRLAETGELSENTVRQAIKTLEAIGFLVRLEGADGYRVTADGLRRKPSQFRFAAEVEALFRAAHRPARRRHDTSASPSKQAPRSAVAMSAVVMATHPKASPTLKPLLSQGGQAIEAAAEGFREAVRGGMRLSASALRRRE
jgi:biotin operon repressor